MTANTDRVTVTSTSPRSAISPEAQMLPGMLHGKDIPNKHRYDVEVLMEMPWHKHAIQYLAMGLPKNTVCELCSCDKSTLFDLMRTPWFMERVQSLMSAGQTDMMALIKSAGVGAVVTLIEVCDNSKAPASARIAAAKEILDRNLGKSLVTVESKVEHTSGNPVEDVRRMEEELLRLRENERQASPFQHSPQ